MAKKIRFTGDKYKRAMSPLTCIMLAVATTVILSVFIATFVVDLDEEFGNNIPSASFSYNETRGDITYQTGEILDSDNIVVTVTGESDVRSYQFNQDIVTAGDTVGVRAGEGDIIRVVWKNKDYSKLVFERTL